MLEDRDYMRAASGGWRWSATAVLIGALIIAFLLQKGLLSKGFTNDYLALSLDGIRHGFVWELLTFQFLHGGLLHLLGNCLVIYFFGRDLEMVLGKSRFLTLYFGSGIAGGMLQIAGAYIWPSHFGGAVVGASAGGFGLVAAFATLDPDRLLTMLLYFFIPVRMRAKTLVLISLAMAALGIAFPQSMFGGNVAHGAHLGGILAGIAWVKLGWHRDYIRLPWENLGSRWHHWRRWRPRQSSRELVKTASIKSSKWPSSMAHKYPDLPSEEFISREVDPILDKISEHGIQSLTERERKILEAARKRMAKR